MKKFKIKLSDMLDHIRYQRNKWIVYGSGPMDYSKGRKVISFRCNLGEYMVEFIGGNNKNKRVEYFTSSKKAVQYFNDESLK